MSGHTKRPWEVARTDAGIIVRTESKKKTRYGASRYAAIGGFDRSDPEQLAEALANAHLIAAAPELLEALKELVDAYCRAGAPLTREERAEDRKRFFAAIAAIAKAAEEPYAADERTQHSWS